MQIGFNPVIYQKQNDFQQVLNTLAQLRDPSKPNRYRIVLNAKQSGYSISTGQKPTLFQRICAFFYKPKHLRLRHIIEKTVQFLEGHEHFLMESGGIERLIQFQMSLYSIHKIHNKAANSLKRLDALIHRVSEQYEKNYKEAKSVGKSIQLVMKEKNEKIKLIQKTRAALCAKITSQQIENTTLKRNTHDMRLMSRSISLKMTPHVPTIGINIKFYVEVYVNRHNVKIYPINTFFLHDYMLPSFQRDPTCDKWGLTLNHFSEEIFLILRNLMYGDEIDQTLTLKDFIQLSWYAEELKQSRILSEFTKIFESMFKADPYAALDSLTILLNLEGNDRECLYPFFIQHVLQNDFKSLHYPKADVEFLKSSLSTLKQKSQNPSLVKDADTLLQSLGEINVF